MSLLCNFSEAPALIKEQLVLSNVIEAEGVTLKKQGGEWVGLCPMPDHDEKTPSFHVNDEKGVYLCRGCGATGDVINFVAQRNGQSHGQAIRSLARKIGYTIRASEQWKQDNQNQRPSIGSDSRDRLAELHDQVAQVAHETLKLLIDEPDHPVTEYLMSTRGYTRDIIDQYGLGFLPFTKTLYDLISTESQANPNPTTLGRRQWETLATEAGLIRQGRPHSMFQGRLLFPIIGTGGKCVAFSARVIPAISDQAILADRKYLNTSATFLFDKSKTLFGASPWRYLMDQQTLASDWHRRMSGHLVVLVEGLTDVLRLAQLGIHAVASMGTAITHQQLRLLFRQFRVIIVLTDADTAGIEAAEKSLLTGMPMLTPGLRFYSATLPLGEDPDSFFQSSKRDSAENRLLSLPTITPEVVWFERYVGHTDNPLSLADQVTIEHALSGSNDIPVPVDPYWLVALHRYVADRTGYLTRPYANQRGMGLPAQDMSSLLDDDTSAFWLYRVARYPSLLQGLKPYAHRWWVNDAINGLLANPLECPPALRLLFTAYFSLNRSEPGIRSADQWSELAVHLIDSGFPSSLLAGWADIAYDTDQSLATLGYVQEVFAPDLWEHELKEWVEDIDHRLTDKLTQAVIAS